MVRGPLWWGAWARDLWATPKSSADAWLWSEITLSLVF